MKKIKLLDCTLRDGGYINDWDFGHSVITGTYKRLDAAGVDYIEVGFLDDRRIFDINRTIQPNTDCYNHIFSGITKRHAIPVAMIDFGTCDLANIGNCDSTFIDGIRVIFKKEKIDKALPFCKAIKEKGYKLFIQAISITAYSDLDMLEYIQKINEIKPYVFSIVDTYGLLDSRKLKNYFNLMNNNLDPEIKIGYHAHNNFQLAFSNSIKFLALETKRTIVVDATVYGMGKSAGNTPCELIGMHMNQRYGTSYDIDQFLEILDTDLMSIYRKHYWGYKYNFYISAMQNCHPNYVQFLLDKKTLSVTSINEILSRIPKNIKLLYDQKYIENAYIDYQSNVIDDQEAIYILTNLINRRPVLLLGPGNSIKVEEDRINDFIQLEKPAIISVNFEPNEFKCDAVFVSNAKRYSKLADTTEKQSYARLITTSNISLFDRVADAVLNYSELIEKNGLESDNSLLLILAALLRCNVKRVYLAGFDGFKSDNNDYYDLKYEFAGNEKYKVSLNEIIKKGIKKFSQKMKIEFLTKTLYADRLSDESKFEYAIFDLDGTLLDTSEGIISAMIEAIHKENMNMPDKHILESFIGPPIQDSFKKLYALSDKKAITLANSFRDVYKMDNFLFKAKPYNGILELIAELVLKGIKIGIATYKREDYAKRLLYANGFNKYTNFMYGADFEGQLKKEDIIRICLDNMGCTDYSKAVYIGDSKSDGEGANVLGISFIAVTYGFGFKHADDTKEYNPIGIAKNCNDILEIIMKM